MEQELNFKSYDMKLMKGDTVICEVKNLSFVEIGYNSKNDVDNKTN